LSDFLPGVRGGELESFVRRMGAEGEDVFDVGREAAKSGSGGEGGSGRRGGRSGSGREEGDLEDVAVRGGRG
jgi:hypothetical protein